MNALIFVAAISEYDQRIREDNQTVCQLFLCSNRRCRGFYGGGDIAATLTLILIFARLKQVLFFCAVGHRLHAF